MNNEELQRKYEISLWTLQDSFITVLKPSGLKWEGQGLDPHLIIKDDGDRTLSFKIPMYLRRNGQFVENPIWHNTRNGVLMVNLRKLKVIFNKGTADEAIFELVITKVTESHEGFEKYCEVEAEGLAFHELGKQGYTITLSGQADVDFEYPEGEYENNINFWCDRVLENSTWTYSVQMDWSSEDGVIDNISKPYGQLTQEERDELNAAREAKGLRRRDKIYEDSYVSSWKYNANRDAIVPTEVVDQKEKFRLVEGSESNRYNLTQSIAEIFQVYCKYKYYYDENYHIIGREVIFYNNFLQDGGEVLDFTYHYNTQSISREMDGADLVSKMYVKNLVDADSPTGEVNLYEASANKSLENYLLNFDYLYSIGTITEEQYNSIDDYEKKIRAINEEMMGLEEKIRIIDSELPKLKAQKATLIGDEESGTTGSIQLAQENIANANAYLNSLTSSDGTNDGYITIGEENPQILYILSETNSRGRVKYYANVSVLGISERSVKLFKTRTTEGKLKGRIKPITFSRDVNGNIKKITGLPNLAEGKCYATFKYRPQTEYENIIVAYTTKLNRDKAKLEEITPKIEEKEAAKKNYEKQLEAKGKEKQLIINAFEALMGPALREGMWQPGDDYVKFGDRKSDRLVIKNNSKLSSSDLISFGWDTRRFEDYEDYHYDLIGVNSEKSYYPCINLSASITSDGHKQKIFKHMLARLNGDAEHNIDADEDYLTTFTFSFVNASEKEIHDAGADDIQCREFLTIGSGLEFAYLRKNDEVIPVLMITGANTLVDGNSRQIRDQVSNKALIGVMETTLVPATTPEGSEEEVPEHIDVTFKDPINLFNKNTGETLNGVWITNLGDYKRVFPRIKIKSRYLKVSQDNLKIRPRGATETLKENYGYYLLPDGDSYYITLKPEDFFKYSTSIFKNGKSYDVSYTISNTALAVYLDAVKVLKESAYPKVSYQIDPSIVNENFFYNAYNRLNQLAHINDYELKFENVMGYISEIDLDLDKPWEDKVTVKNYKSKFEDLFSTIVAETEQMKKNAYVTDLVTSAISNKGELTPEVFAKALTSVDTSIPLMRVFNDNQLLLASQMSASAAANMASLANTTAFRVMTGDTGLAFQGGVIDDIQVNKVYGLVIQGHLSDSQEDPKNTFFRVDNDQMGFFRGTYNDPNKQWEPLLYFENGDLALSGNIYAKNGWFGGERGWIIGEGVIGNNTDNKNSFPVTMGNNPSKIKDFGGLFYSANGKMIFSAGLDDENASAEEKKPHIILYQNGMTTDKDENGNLIVTQASSNPILIYDGNSLSIKGAITATSLKIGPNETEFEDAVSSEVSEALTRKNFATLTVDSTTGYILLAAGDDTFGSGELKLSANGIQLSSNGSLDITTSNFMVNSKASGTNLVFRLGPQNSPFLSYSASNGLSVKGIITATSGQIGGWDITSTQLSSTQEYTIDGVTDKYTSGLRSSVSGTGTYLLAIGSKGDAGVGNWSYAPFRVTKEGKLYATDAIITGAITATSLTLGNNVKIGKGDITDGDKIIFKGQTISSEYSSFEVSNEGLLTAANASISGVITASAGQIGGWIIGGPSVSPSTLRSSIYATETYNDGYSDALVDSNTVVAHRWSANSSHKYKLSIGAPVVINDKTGEISSISWDNAAFNVRKDGKVFMSSASIEGKTKIGGQTIIDTTGKINLTGSEIRLRSSATGAKSYFRFGAYEGSGITPKGADSESYTTSSGFLRIRVDGEDPAVYSFDKNFSYIDMSRNYTFLNLTESTETLGIASIGLRKKYNDYPTASGVKGDITALSDSIFLQSRDFISVESPFILLRGSKSNSNLYRIIVYNKKEQVRGSFEEIDVTGYYANDFNGNLTGNILIQIPNDYTNVSEWTECKVYYRTNPDYLPHE